MAEGAHPFRTKLFAYLLLLVFMDPTCLSALSRGLPASNGELSNKVRCVATGHSATKKAALAPPDVVRVVLCFGISQTPWPTVFRDSYNRLLIELVLPASAAFDEFLAEGETSHICD